MKNKITVNRRKNEGWAIIKTITILLALGIFVFTIILANKYWFEIYKPETKAINEYNRQIKTSNYNESNKPDPGLVRFERSIELIKQNEIKKAQKNLMEICNFYKRSEKYQISKTVLSQINLDLLFNGDEIFPKQNYTVKKGESISTIINNLAKRKENPTKMLSPFLMAINGLTNFHLQPGQKLKIYHVKFDAILDLSEQKLIVNQDGQFFTEYDINNYKLPPTMELPKEIEVKLHRYTIGNKNIASYNSRFNRSRKWLINQKWGFIIYTLDDEDDKKSEVFDLEKIYGLELNKSDMEEVVMLLIPGTKIKIQN